MDGWMDENFIVTIKSSLRHDFDIEYSHLSSCYIQRLEFSIRSKLCYSFFFPKVDDFERRFLRRDFDRDSTISRGGQRLGYVVVAHFTGKSMRKWGETSNSGENTGSWKWRTRRATNPGIHPARFINLDICLGNPIKMKVGSKSKINTKKHEGKKTFSSSFSNTFFEIVLRFSNVKQQDKHENSLNRSFFRIGTVSKGELVGKDRATKPTR